jgi:polysaccharide biosynthesis transport protein
MQPNDSFSVPRRTLDVEDYIDIGRRHKGWIFGPFLFCVVATVVGVYLWPDSYTSQAMIKITPQRVPESMVQSAITQQMYDRILSMQQDIESRTVLTAIIQNYGLYPRERRVMPTEDVVEEMKKKIQVVPLTPTQSGATRTVPAFMVQFSYSDRFLAQRVVSDLVGRFIDQNTRNRSDATFQTTQFMKDELERAKKELDELENRLAQFRTQNNGKLPDQVGSNMQSLSALQMQVTALDSSISRATQDKLQLEALVRILQSNLADLRKQPQESPAAAQRNERLRQRYTENWPDVQSAVLRLKGARDKRAEILKEDEAKKAEAKSDAPVKPVTNPMAVREMRDLDSRIQQIQSQIEAKDLEIQEYTKSMKRSGEAVRGYQARLESVPLGEKEYGELIRDRDIAKAKYVELDGKLQRAQVAQEMENRKQGENLELLDPASLPLSPTEPKRPMVISIGAGIGLLLGIMIAGAREMKDTSLKNLKDVRAYTQMAILGSIPLLENDFVVRRRRRLSWLGWTTACLAAVVIVSGSIVYYYVTKA